MKLTANVNLLFFISIFALKWCINSHLKHFILFRQSSKEISLFIILILYIHNIWLIFCWKIIIKILLWSERTLFPTVKFTFMLKMINSYLFFFWTAFKAKFLVWALSYLDVYQTLALNKGKPRRSHIIHSLCKINACTPMTAWFNFLLSFSVARCHGHRRRAVVILAATIWTSAALSMKQTATKSHDLIKSLFCL